MRFIKIVAFNFQRHPHRRNTVCVVDPMPPGPPSALWTHLVTNLRCGAQPSTSVLNDRISEKISPSRPLDILQRT